MLVGLKMMPVHESVLVPLFANSIADGVFHASELQETFAKGMLDALAKWAPALKAAR